MHGDEPLLVARGRRRGARRGAQARLSTSARCSSPRRASTGASCSTLARTCRCSAAGKSSSCASRAANPASSGGAAIASYCAKPNPDNLLLVTMPRPEGPVLESRLVHGARRAPGVIVEVQSRRIGRACRTGSARASRATARASSAEAMEFLVDRVEGNLLAAHQEIQKLALLAPRGELDMETKCATAVASVARFDPFVAQRRACYAGDMKRYVRAIDGLRGEGESAAVHRAGDPGRANCSRRAADQAADGLAAEGRSMDEAIDVAENRVWKRRAAGDPRREKALQAPGRGCALRAAVLHVARIERASQGRRQRANPGMSSSPWG